MNWPFWKLAAAMKQTKCSSKHQLITSPLLNFAAVKHHAEAFPSRGLLGTTIGERLYMNTNTPSCGTICGVQVSLVWAWRTDVADEGLDQGSGKSHTLSCILEASLIVDSRIGRLPQPLTALVYASEPAIYCHAQAMTGFILTSKTVIDLLRLPCCHAPHLRTQAKNIETASQRSQCCARKHLPNGCDSPHSLPSLLDQATSRVDAMRTPPFRTFASSRSTSRSKTSLRTGCWRSWDATIQK
jgi:hypothetical protein